MSERFPSLPAGAEGVVRADLLDFLTEAGRKGRARADVDEWARRSGAPDLAKEALDVLLRQGEVIEWRRRLLALRHTDWRVGTIRRVGGGGGRQRQAGDGRRGPGTGRRGGGSSARGRRDSGTRRGPGRGPERSPMRGRNRGGGRSDRGALFLGGAGSEATHFIPASNLRGARDGDRVLVRPAGSRRRGSSGPRPGKLPEATVVKVLARGRSEIVGFLRGGDRLELVPFDSRVRLDVELPDGSEALAGRFVAAVLAPEAEAARGRVPVTSLDDLGDPTEAGTDVRVVLRHFEIPEVFPPDVLEQAAGFPETPPPPGPEREDLRSLVTVTIDGRTARDFDDAISLTERPDGGVSLAVHIADVAEYVTVGSPLDREAYRRGTSVYFPDRAVPMLPESLSNGLCSLRPGVERFTLTAFLELSAAGELESRRFAESVIVSDRRLTYSEVRRVLEEPQDGDRAEYGPVLELLESARRLMERLFRQRLDRGSIDFDLPEGSVVLDTDGVTVGVKPGERNVAHRIIEELMIATNEAVARELSGAELPALYRVHDEPERGRFEELRSFLEPLGIPLELTAEMLHPSLLQEVLRAVEGHDEEPFVSTLVLRAMKRAYYDPDCRGHYALASPAYSHFTSPIRRYPDLLVHRELKRWLRARSDEDREERRRRLPAIAESTSATERRAERAERTLLQWKIVRLLEERTDEVFRARVTGVQPFGLFVQLDDYFVDALLPVAELTDDFYTYEEERHRLVGRSGKTYRLADAVDVRLIDVDVVGRRLVVAPAAANVEPRDKTQRSGKQGEPASSSDRSSASADRSTDRAGRSRRRPRSRGKGGKGRRR